MTYKLTFLCDACQAVSKRLDLFLRELLDDYRWHDELYLLVCPLQQCLNA